MPITTCYIDVDLTLVDVYGNLLPGVREGLEWLSHRYTLVCWSAGGRKYAEGVCRRHAITCYFRTILDKPDIIIDDSPHTLVKASNVVEITARDSWYHLQDKIFHKDTNIPEKEEQE